MITYDTHFNANEWFVIILSIVSYALVWSLPKYFLKAETITYIAIGGFIGFFFDHTISVQAFNFYDVNDRSVFQFMDFLSYVMYGPFAYFFLYIWARCQLKLSNAPIYIFVWSFFSMLMEWIGVKCGVYHYQMGYKLYYSFGIYIVTQIVLLSCYYVIQKQLISQENSG
ncbi:hypothetical protein [Priestia koreensis]|uniref:hypothetical protein n=1 Tax=Priestia koreensis TaxID=284581 RepID=UPI00301B00AF